MQISGLSHILQVRWLGLKILWVRQSFFFFCCSTKPKIPSLRALWLSECSILWYGLWRLHVRKRSLSVEFELIDTTMLRYEWLPSRQDGITSVSLSSPREHTSKIGMQCALNPIWNLSTSMWELRIVRCSLSVICWCCPVTLHKRAITLLVVWKPWGCKTVAYYNSVPVSSQDSILSLPSTELETTQGLCCIILRGPYS